MTAQTRFARDIDAARRQTLTRMEPDDGVSASAMGAETAEYVEGEIDPQWMTAWKMFLDRDGDEYGVPVRVPINQYFGRGPNHLQNLRRPDGGFWFQVEEPDRKIPDPTFECFVGECTKKLHKRIDLVNHVRASHVNEANAYGAILTRIEQKVAEEDPRLQRLLASMEDPQPEFVAGDVVVLTCPECGKESPEDHHNPEAWLTGHINGAHKSKVVA